MVKPFLSILHQIWQNLAQNSHKFAIGIMATRDCEILTISCGMILREEVVRIMGTRVYFTKIVQQKLILQWQITTGVWFDEW